MTTTKDEDIEAYQAAVRAIALVAKLVVQHDIPKFLEAIEHADSVGPLLEPTLWREKRKAMLEDRELLRAALPLFDLGKKLEMLVTKKGVRVDGNT
jgi:hypothetical protein